MKKMALALVLMLTFCQITLATELPVKVKALNEITTANSSLQEGDAITLVVAKDVYANSKLYIKEGTPVKGIITSLVGNGFTCDQASMYIENFKVENVNGENVKLSGIIYQKGRDHSRFTQFIPQDSPLSYIGFFIRGGEAKILPDKDMFTLYLEVKDEIENL